jgi:uncharacterized protein involved in tolerance to divalent cations
MNLAKAIKLNPMESANAKELICIMEKSFKEKKEMLLGLVNSILYCANETEHAKELAMIAKSFLEKFFDCKEHNTETENYDYEKMRKKIELIRMIQANPAESPYAKELSEMVKQHLEMKLAGCCHDSLMNNNLMIMQDHEKIATRKKELVLLIKHCHHQSDKAKRLAYIIGEWMNYMHAHCHGS